MSSIVQLKRSALSGKVPGTGSLNLGELALNTYDGKIFFRRSGSTDTIQEVVTTNSTVTGSIRLEGTGSFGSLRVNDTLTINHGETIISGSALVTSDLTILGAVNARQFNISVISSSVLFESGSSRFGNTSDDTHSFTGSVNVTGSLYLNGVAVGGASNSGSFTGSFTGSFFGDGSGLRGVVSDDIPREGWDYDSNSSASINDFNDVSDKYFIDFAQSQSTEVGTPVGYKGFLTNVSGSTQILPTLDGIDFVVGNNVVASIGVGGIIAQATAGTVSGSSQLTSSYDSRYVLSGSITQTTWDNIASKPGGIVSGSSQVVGILSSLNTYTGSNDTTNTAQNTRLTTIESVTGSYETKGRSIVSGSSQITFSGISSLPTLVSGSSQLTASVLATTGSNTFIGNQSISGTLYLTGSLIPSGNFVYDLGSETNSFKDLFLSTGSIRFHNPDGTEQGRITVDAKSGDISLLKTAGLTNEQKATISQGNINPDFLTAISASSLFIQTKIVTAAGATINGINLTAFSSSIASTLLNQNSATSSYETKGRGIISGSSQLNNASIENLTVINLTTVNETASVIFSSGSNRFGDFGNDTHSFTGSVQISGSFTLVGSSTATSYNGTINATNGVVSGSAQITYASISSIPSGIVSGSTQTIANLPTGTVSGSSQVVSILSSLNTYTGSNDTTNTAQNTRLTTIESVTGSYETKGRSIVSGSSQITFSGISSLPTLVSGSSQITLSSTTGYGSVLNQAVLTTSSPTFVNLTATGTITETSSLRYKENIETIKYGLDKVLQMRGVTYNKKDNGVKEVGVIAEEIYEVLPEVVLKNEEGDIDSVSYSRITAVLIEAIKDLKKEIEDLKANR